MTPQQVCVITISDTFLIFGGRTDFTSDFATDVTADCRTELRQFSDGRTDFTINLEK